MVSQHALQVSRPTPRGKVEGSGRGGLLGGGGLLRGVPALEWGAWLGGVVCSQGGCGEPPVTATAVGGTHPTGMHSCYHDVYLMLNPLSLSNRPNKKTVPEVFTCTKKCS